jgi:hypothetical protein
MSVTNAYGIPEVFGGGYTGMSLVVSLAVLLPTCQWANDSPAQFHQQAQPLHPLDSLVTVAIHDFPCDYNGMCPVRLES